MRGISVFFAVAVYAVPAAAQPLVTRCVSCHTANRAIVPSPGHLVEWESSPHARAGIGCEKCHGGDPWADRPADAHRGVLSPVSARSPVNSGNLVKTCAPCHGRNAQAFSSSLHHVLVQAEERRAPTCITCHGAMSARVPSPAALEARCAACHPPGSAREAYPGQMREAVETLNRIGVAATSLETDVVGLMDRDRRVELLVALTAAHTTVKEAIARVHAFDLEGVAERTALARTQLDAVAAAVRGLP